MVRCLKQLTMNRRTSLKYTAGLSTLLSLGFSPLNLNQLRTRIIPSSGEKLPLVGVGTWQTFDVGPSEGSRAELKKVVKALVAQGATVIDSSPMYGRSEGVVGDLIEGLGVEKKIFGATKVWTQGLQQGIAQMNRSMNLMAQSPMDLMQVHNLMDWKTHLKTLFEWKEQGRIRYVGITHYQSSAYHRMEEIMKLHPIDFIQVNYSMGSTTSGDRLIPLAADLGIGVIINRPYQGGSLFNQVRNKSLPSWIKDVDCSSWASFFLKFIVSNPAVTCAIPGTSQEIHLIENLNSGSGFIPNEKQRNKMLSYFRSL